MPYPLAFFLFIYLLVSFWMLTGYIHYTRARKFPRYDRLRSKIHAHSIPVSAIEAIGS